MGTFTYESIAYRFKNPTIDGNLDLLTDGAIIHRGIYEDSKEKLRAYTMIGGLDAPTKRLEELKKYLKIR